MLIRLRDLRSLINEAIARNRGVKLVRVGGLSPVSQKKGTAPENSGVWAFIWPYVEPFLLGSTGPEGAHPGEGKSRYDQMKREGLTKFIHSSVIYTHLHVPTAQNINGWWRTDGDSLAAYLTKHFANTHKGARQSGHGLTFGQNPWTIYDKDEFEVFVPRPDEKGF